MSAVVRFVKVTLLGGVLFLLPLVIVLSVVREAVRHAANLLRPIAKYFPTERLAGVLVVDLLAIAAIVALCFLMGLVIATPPGRALSRTFEQRVLMRVPGYLFLKALMQGAAGFENDAQFAAAIVRLDDSSMLGFVVERDDEGMVVVFVPSAPTPAVGSLYFVTEDRVQMLRVPPLSAVSSIARLGVGLAELMRAARRANEEQVKRRGSP